MAAVVEDTVFGIILDHLKEEHVLCIKADKDSSVPRLCVTAVNTTLAQTLQCTLKVDEPEITLTTIKAALAGGKIHLDSQLKQINIKLKDRNLTEKLNVLSGNNQNKEIGVLLQSMIKRIEKLEKTIVGEKSSPETAKPAPATDPKEVFYPTQRLQITNPRKRCRSMMSKKSVNIHAAGIQFESSSDSD